LIYDSNFSQLLSSHNSKTFAFRYSTLSFCSFSDIDFEKSVFKSNHFKNISFVNCILSSSTLANTNANDVLSYNSIDFHSINSSDHISAIVLKNIFGITEPDIKGYVEGLVKEISLQSVFISYSFRNREIAHILNNSLRAKGVITFLWENDAPGGQRLKKIMSDYVRKLDRILFVASEDSLKSQACQFELSEGRKKQNQNWKTVLFPIHIDNYLFEVERDDIKPNEVRKEYWRNILELRDINSLDFSTVEFDKAKFDKMITRIVKDLRK
jgi:hypothetical protein